ncbi:MAG: glutathione S-transferase family protein [Cellvibrionales bacterium]|nr:glutathione S-transferase family protein [Cellvibrionales bacterium]
MIDLYVFTPKSGLPFDPHSVYLESFLNASQLSFQTYHSNDFSAKAQFPYFRENHINLTETGFIINYFEEKLEFDFDGHLDESMKATHFAYEQLLLSAFVDCLDHVFWLDEANVSVIKSLLSKDTPPPLVALKIKKIQKSIDQRLSHRMASEVAYKRQLTEAKKTMAYLSQLLGERRWFGGLYLSKLDLVVYACLKSLLLDNFTSGLHEAFKQTPNLIYHNKRISALFAQVAVAEVDEGTE